MSHKPCISLFRLIFIRSYRRGMRKHHTIKRFQLFTELNYMADLYIGICATDYSHTHTTAKLPWGTYKRTNRSIHSNVQLIWKTGFFLFGVEGSRSRCIYLKRYTTLGEILRTHDKRNTQLPAKPTRIVSIANKSQALAVEEKSDNAR